MALKNHHMTDQTPLPKIATVTSRLQVTIPARFARKYGLRKGSIGRFPGATRIFTDDAQPFEAPEHNRELLRSLGYTHVAGTHRIFGKGVGGV
jgi:hypothetical protein